MENLYKRIDVLFQGQEHIEEKLKKICQLLHNEVEHYNWVGFYFKNGDKRELKLSAYEGAPTEHEIIPYGRGICGQVAESNKLFVVPDVNSQDNYLACSIETKSEIVVPVIKDGENIGQIDIDSHQIDPFSDDDIKLLEYICKYVAEQI